MARRILAFLHDRVAVLDNPRSMGQALKGSRLGKFWKYQLGDYRIISSIEDEGTYSRCSNLKPAGGVSVGTSLLDWK